MKIKIVEGNRTKIHALLGEINGKSVSHTAGQQNIFDLAELMEVRLDKLNIAKKDRAGATASGMSGGDVRNAYKYSRIVTSYNIERGASDWFLIAVSKYANYGNAAKPRLSLTVVQRDIAVSKFTSQFSVQKVLEMAVAA
jgi:hypothetical protein